MPTILVIWLAKLSAILSRLLGRGDGSALPGLVAERLRPDFLEHFGEQLNGQVVLVTGTNGKTTTTRMIVAALETEDKPMLTNRAGSNLTRGLLSTLIMDCDWQGRLHHQQAVFEVDEAAFPAAVAAFKPSTAVVLNLFRDQLDRYGELNTLASKLKQSLQNHKTVRLVLNADDPLVAWLGHGLKNVSYFGLKAAQVKQLSHDFAADSNACPVCARSLHYADIYYAHIGRYVCTNHDFKQPTLSVVGTTTKVNLSGSASTIAIGRDGAALHLKLPGLYNVYNALAAVATSDALGRALETTVEKIEGTQAAFGRAEIVTLAGRQLQLLLVKNPTGFNQVIQTYLLEDSQLPMLILVNDLIADGRDVSWLWDVAFEDLSQRSNIIASGTRAFDLALRLKYADLKFDVQTNPETALENFVTSLPVGHTGLILPTYTAMLAVRRALAKSVSATELRP